MADRKAYVQTVLGPVAPEDVGITLPHEHLLIDMLGGRSREEVLDILEADWVLGELGAAKGESLLAAWDEPIRLDNYSSVARHWMFYRAALRQSDVVDAIAEARRFKEAGGDCILDATPIGLGRNPAALQEISRRSGVRVVMGTGFYVHPYHPSDLRYLSEEAILDRLLGDIQEGEDDGCLPGVIGEIGLGWPLHPEEEKVLRAASRAQAATGLPLMIHPGRDAAGPLEVLRMVDDAGADVTKTVMGHLDRTIFSLKELTAVARTGCYVAFDLFGRESSYYPQSVVDLPNDATRIDYVLALFAAGHGHQLLLSQDVGLPPFLHKYGGFGYDNLLVNIVPMMRRKGMGGEEIDEVLVANPRRMLTIG